MKTRIFFLDNLRTFLIFLVVLLHAGICYQSGVDSFWIVSDTSKLEPIALVTMYIDIFVMFVMFFISGYFIPNSLKGKNSLGYLKSKFKRIMIPWIIAVLTLIPAYKAIFLYSRGLPQEEWFSYFTFFQRAGSDIYFFSNNPTQSWLWFLPILFLFQVIYLGLSKTKLFSIKISLKAAVSLIFVIGLIYSLIISNYGLKGWEHSVIIDFQRERLLVYFLVFLLGSLCNKLKVFESKIRKRKYYIISNIVLAISLTAFTLVALNFFFNMIDPDRNYFYISEQIDRALYYATFLLSMLSFLQIFIHAFRFSFNKHYTFMEKLNENSYSVYIIHVIVIGVLATILMSISIAPVIKVIILTLSTFILSNAIICGYNKLFKKNTPLKLSALVLSMAILFTFISYGKDIRSIDKNEEATIQTQKKDPSMSLHEAAFFGNLEAVKQHIGIGTDVNIKAESDGASPLIVAITFGKTEVIKALIEAGADVNFIKSDGSTPLHVAAFFGRLEIVQLLLEKGADKSIKNNSGSTASNSVEAPFEAVKPIYDYFGKTLGPLGLKLDYNHLKKVRPQIAEMLQ